MIDCSLFIMYRVWIWLIWWSGSRKSREVLDLFILILDLDWVWIWICKVQIEILAFCLCQQIFLADRDIPFIYSKSHSNPVLKFLDLVQILCCCLYWIGSKYLIITKPILLTSFVITLFFFLPFLCVHFPLSILSLIASCMLWWLDSSDL